jgi:hypothetical protein
MAPSSGVALLREAWAPRRVLLVGVAACYAVACASLHAQLPGLLGRDGLAPIAARLRDAEARIGSAASLGARFRALPTLLWLAAPLQTAPDALAGALCLLGACVAGALVASCALRVRPGGLLTAASFLLLHALYASLLAVGHPFLSFQWDILLLESLVLCVLLAAPGGALPPALELPPRVLMFKLMLMSGAVKLQSGCHTWSDLSALTYHFSTQPLPTPLAWHASALPTGLLRLGVAGALVLEGPAAWLLLCPLRGARTVGVALQVVFQVTIALTGNYCYFNALTAVLALACLPPPSSARVLRSEPLLSFAVVVATAAVSCLCFRLEGGGLDGLRLNLPSEVMTDALGVALPATFRVLFCAALPAAALQGCVRAMRSGKRAGAPLRVAGALLAALAAGVLCTLTTEPLASLLPANADSTRAFKAALPPLPSSLRALAASAHASSAYGLFRSMTGVGADDKVARPELQFQGRSEGAGAGDESGWRDIRFAYKPEPGALDIAPRWVAPHQPRLDWQLWFAALSGPGAAPWAIHLAAHLLRGTPDVYALLAPGAFSPEAPPAEVRVGLFELAFTAPGSKAAQKGRWWARGGHARDWLQALRQGPELDAWLKERGWAPPRGKRRPASGRLAWARGGQWWAGIAAAAAGGGVGACLAMRSARTTRSSAEAHQKRE